MVAIEGSSVLSAVTDVSLAIVTGQLQEMEMIRSKVYQLEQAQLKMKAEYAPSSPVPCA